MQSVDQLNSDAAVLAIWLTRAAHLFGALLRRDSGRDHLVRLGGTNVQAFAPLAETWPGGSAVYRLRAEGLSSPGLVIIPEALAAQLFQVLLGGTVGIASRSQRPARGEAPGIDGAVTRRVLGRLVNTLLAALTAAANELAPSLPLFLKRASDQWSNVLTPYQNLQGLMGANEPALVACLSVSGSGDRGELQIVFPRAALAPLVKAMLAAANTAFHPGVGTLKSVAAAAPGKLGTAAGGDPQASILAASVDLVCQFGEAHMLIGELSALAVGDVIQLAAAADAPAILLVGGVPKFKCRPGVKDGQRAFRLHRAS